METKIKNRWLIALSAVGIHISIGSVYAYSVITNPVKEIFALEGSTIKWSFKIAIFILGLSAAIFGKWVEKVGPKKSGIIAGIFYGIGIIGSGLAVHFESLVLFFLFYGFIGGIGLGLGYITPVSTLVKWFPDKRGLATGIAIMGFGFSSLIFGPLMAQLFELIGVSNTFYLLGIIYFIIMLISSNYIAKPPLDYVPKGYVKNSSTNSKNTIQTTLNEALKTSHFYYIWIIMFINIACGIAIISAASPLIQEKLNYSALAAAGIVGFIGVFNGFGRILWSGLSDYFGRANTYILFFAFQILAFYFLPKIGIEAIFLLVLFIIITMYGGGFATLPAFLSDLFGTKQLGAIHGAILTAWSLAGIVGPTLYDFVMNKTKSLNTALSIFSGLFIVALLVSLKVKTSIKK